MGAKDRAERALLQHGDVFADAFNARLFDGRRVIDAKDLRDMPTQSMLDRRGERGQDRDVAKCWNDACDMRLAILGVENQSRPDPDMPLRVLSYDGAEYRRQLDEGHGRCPVITIVLYFGSQPWRAPTRLVDRLDIPSELEGLVNDYEVRMLDMAHLPPELTNVLESDLRPMATLLASQGDHKPPLDSWPIKHPEDFARTMRAITGDDVWTDDDIIARVQAKEASGKEVTVNDFMSRWVNNAAQELAPKLAEPIAKQMAEQMASQMAEQMAEQMASQMAEQIAEKKAEKMASQLAEKMAEQMVSERQSALAELSTRLEQLNRQDELARAVRDQAYRDQLCRELGIKTAPQA